MQTLKLTEDVFDALEKGKKCTIRKGRRDIQLGELLFESTERGRKQVVNIASVIYTELRNIPEEYIHNDGFEDHKDMLDQMKRFYPDITFETECTVIAFY